MIEFDFLGKDSIQYKNTVAIPKLVYANVMRCCEDKEDDEDLFELIDV